jgi:uncharacterized protein YqgV (UPF0045/DUF77 family)
MKAKSVDQQIKECVKKVSEEDLKFLSQRLSQRLGGDLGESMSLIQERYPELNKVLINTPSCTDLYNVIDVIDRHVQDAANKKMPALAAK